MAADTQVAMLIAEEVLPEHHQKQQYYDQHAGKFNSPLADAESAGGLFEQGRLYRRNRLAANDNRFAFFDRNYDRLDFIFGGAAAGIAFGFVVGEVGQEQRTEDFAELA